MTYTNIFATFIYFSLFFEAGNLESPEARSSAFLPFSSYECRGNNAVITRLSRGNHALFYVFTSYFLQKNTFLFVYIDFLLYLCSRNVHVRVRLCRVRK